MNEKKFQYVELGIENLIVNKDNYRHEPLNSEQEAIDRFCSKTKEKMLKLLTSIINNDVFPSITFLVTKIADNQYKVLDGNRRLTAIKILNNPNLIPNSIPDLKLYVTRNKKDFSNLKIRCIEYFNEINAGNEIYDLHSGMSNTDEKWTRTAQIRYQRKFLNITPPQWFLVIEKNLPIYLESLEQEEGISTVERIFKQNIIETYMPVDPNNKIIDSSHIVYFTKVLADITSKTHNTRTLNQNSQIIDYLNSVFGKPKTSIVKKTKTITTKIKKPKTIIIETFQIKNITLSNKKLANDKYAGIKFILDEIKEMASTCKGKEKPNYEIYPLSTLFLIRSIMEQTLKFFLFEYYPDEYKKVTNNGNQEATLTEMMKKVSNMISAKSKGSYIFNSEIDRRFKASIFDQSAGNTQKIDLLNIIIHSPQCYTSTTVINDYCRGPVYELLKYILMELQ